MTVGKKDDICPGGGEPARPKPLALRSFGETFIPVMGIQDDPGFRFPGTQRPQEMGVDMEVDVDSVTIRGPLPICDMGDPVSR